MGSTVWTNQGGGTAGLAGVPQLEMTGPLTASPSLGLDLSQGAPSVLAVVFISFGSTPAAFKGGTLHAAPVGALVAAATDGTGSLSGSPTFPGAAPGTQLWFQVALDDASVPGGGGPRVRPFLLSSRPFESTGGGQGMPSRMRSRPATGAR